MRSRIGTALLGAAWGLVLARLLFFELYEGGTSAHSENEDQDENDAVVAVAKLALTSPKFFMYRGPGFGQEGLLKCIPEWDDGPFSQHNSEVWLYRALLIHPARTESQSAANIFVAPIFLHLSYLAGQCLGTSHVERMRQSANALRNSKQFQANTGRDHLLLTNHWSLQKITTAALAPLLANFTTAWFETCASNPNCGYGYMPARCQVVVPYVQQQYCRNLPSDKRKVAAFFRGSADFLYSKDGLAVRKQMMKVQGALPGSVIQSLSRKTCITSKRRGDFGEPGKEKLGCFKELAKASAEYMHYR